MQAESVANTVDNVGRRVYSALTVILGLIATLFITLTNFLLVIVTWGSPFGRGPR